MTINQALPLSNGSGAHFHTTRIVGAYSAYSFFNEKLKLVESKQLNKLTLK